MKYSIEFSPIFSILRIKLEVGEVIKATTGAMLGLSPGIELKVTTTTGKGFWGSLGAMFGGVKLFSTEYTALQAGELVLAPSAPGDIVYIPMRGGTIFTKVGAYLAGSRELAISAHGSFRAMFSGKGLFLTKITGIGHLFVNSFGAIIEKDLSPGELYRVDTGHIVAFDESVTYKIKRAAKGIFTTWASGEGFVCDYLGPGRIWIQTRKLSSFARLLSPYLYRRSTSSTASDYRKDEKT